MKRKGTQSDGSVNKRNSGGRQGTIGQAFANAASKAAALPQLEVAAPLGATIDSYNSQNIRNTLVHHTSELELKASRIPAAAADVLAQGRAQRRQKASSSEDEEVNRLTSGRQAEEREAFLGDEDACRYLGQLKDLTSRSTIPTREHLASVVNIVRTHGLHGRRDLSSTAFSLLQHISSLHPVAAVMEHEAGPGAAAVPYVLVNTNAWTLTGCCESFSMDQFDADPLPMRITPFQILNHLISLAYSAVFPPANRKNPARSTALTSGDLLFLKWVLCELELDLRCRLQVFSKAQAPGLEDRKVALLQNCQLWRTFSDSASKTSAAERKEMVQKLMEIIAAPVEPELVSEPSSLEELAFNAGELAAMAAHLLGMLLELYGTAEDAKMFLKHGINRTTTTGGLENVRMVIEAAMVEGLIGSAQVFRTLAQKRAFLSVLHSKDRMRLLAMVVAKGHARRKTDNANYPSLERMHFLYTNPGDVDGYLEADPAEALNYILYDLEKSNLAFNLVDKTADGLALLVSLMSRAAASQLPGEKLKELEKVLGKVVESFFKHASGSQSKTLTPPALLSLRTAQCVVGAAC